MKMKNRFDENMEKQFAMDHPGIARLLADRIYTSRLIGSEPDLVLHGGGNTSLKIRMRNLFGDEQNVLFIKGSGRDLATIDEEGFVGLEMEPLLKIKDLEDLSDDQMESLLKTHTKLCKIV